jgi:hypothetical protein
MPVLYLRAFVTCKKDETYLLYIEDLYTFMIKACLILLRMRNVSDKTFRENQKAHFMFDSFSSKIVPCVSSCGKYVTVVPATDDTIAHAHCVVDI